MTGIDSQSPVPIGQVLAAKYRVERILGMGGMGVVVAAHHLDLDEPVAIKFLQERAADSEINIARFLREARAAAKIKSDYVARVYDVGRLEDGSPYLVMEYLDGEDLNTVVRQSGPLELTRAVEYLLEACDAIAAAHARGIVHRDIKPSNLFLVRRPDGSRAVKVIDFGISKLPSQVVEETLSLPDTSVTRTHSMIGSPLYMAPEQMRSAKHVDARADVWSLGATMFTLLTGQTPFRGETVLAIYESMHQGLTSPRSLVPSLPEELDVIIRQCLMVDADKRPADVAEVAEALAPFAPVRARHLVERIRGTLLASGMLRSGERRAMPAVVSTPHTLPDSPTQQAWTEIGSKSKRARLWLAVPFVLIALAAGWWWTHRAPEPELAREPEPESEAELTARPAREAARTPAATVAPSAAASSSASPSARPLTPRPAGKSKDLWSDPY